VSVVFKVVPLLCYGTRPSRFLATLTNEKGYIEEKLSDNDALRVFQGS